MSGTLLLTILLSAFLLFLFFLKIHMTEYFDNKLSDMNNCFGLECKDCDKKNCTKRVEEDDVSEEEQRYQYRQNWN
jgi:hypothetical protein